jgi:hypothetical protein
VRVWHRRRPGVEVDAIGRVRNPSNESIDLMVKFDRRGRHYEATIYDTLAATWGEEQPSLDAAIEELRRRAESRPPLGRFM